MSVPPAHIVIFGRPGSGKSSLAERLGADHSYALVRTGELLRAAVRRRDYLGERVEAHLAGGNLVPDRLIFELLEQGLRAPGAARLLFDGFPRTMGQVPLLEQFERKLNFQIGCYLEIAVGRAEAIARMTGRRVCPACGATYHVRAHPPKVPETCDRDGTRLEGRPDDAPEVVEVRQQIFDEHAGPILAHYRAIAPDRYVRVNGAQPLEAVYAETCRALGLPTPATA
ncbi:MAG TPA: nucleoside monophosphate kinase [Isosphaeraceae bacterium]